MTERLLRCCDHPSDSGLSSCSKVVDPGAARCAFCGADMCPIHLRYFVIAAHDREGRHTSVFDFNVATCQRCIGKLQGGIPFDSDAFSEEATSFVEKVKAVLTEMELKDIAKVEEK